MTKADNKLTITSENATLDISFYKMQIDFSFSNGEIQNDELQELVTKGRRAVASLADLFYTQEYQDELLVWVTTFSKDQQEVFSGLGWGYFNEDEKEAGIDLGNGKTRYDFADYLSTVIKQVETYS